jgi:NAD(P) transhydrogenase
VHDSDSILQIDHIPRSLCGVGAGAIGCEYATIFAAMGTKVILVHGPGEILPFLDREIAKVFLQELTRSAIELCNSGHIEAVSVEQTAGSERVQARCADGRNIEAERFLYATGRNGNTQDLGLERAGLRADEHGTLKVDGQFRTAVPHIYAAGDVIGFPALGSTSMEQGRMAVINMFGLHDLERIASHLPFGIYTIPEMAMVGLTEEKAREQGLEVAVARARYQDTPRGLILGLRHGLLKIICERHTQEILGVHIIGESATELIHYGMELVENHEPLKRILGTVFNFPTLHELYKYAAYDPLSSDLR